jgi:hypothetical protein
MFSGVNESGMLPQRRRSTDTGRVLSLLHDNRVSRYATNCR